MRVRFRSTAFEPDVETWTSKHNGANTTFLSPCQSISLVRRPSTLATCRAIGPDWRHMQPRFRTRSRARSMVAVCDRTCACTQVGVSLDCLMDENSGTDSGFCCFDLSSSPRAGIPRDDTCSISGLQAIKFGTRGICHGLRLVLGYTACPSYIQPFLESPCRSCAHANPLTEYTARPRVEFLKCMPLAANTQV